MYIKVMYVYLTSIMSIIFFYYHDKSKQAYVQNRKPLVHVLSSMCINKYLRFYESQLCQYITMSRKDLTLIEKISILDKIKAQPHTSLRELEKLIGTSKSALNRLKNNEIAIREQYNLINLRYNTK